MSEQLICKYCKKDKEEHLENGKCISRCRCHLSDNWKWEPVKKPEIKEFETINEAVDYYVENRMGDNPKQIIGIILGTHRKFRKQAREIAKLVQDKLETIH